jgi:biotin carboxylase
MFNIEMMYDAATGRIAIVEVNPRMCGQFADLYEKVDGTNGYEVALALAVGESPVIERRAGRYRAAASYPLRIFAPMEVVKTPGEREMANAHELFPGTLLWNECREGDALSDFESVEDGRSARYGVVNLGAPDKESLMERRERVLQCLDYRFRPL